MKIFQKLSGDGGPWSEKGKCSVQNSKSRIQNWPKQGFRPVKKSHKFFKEKKYPLSIAAFFTNKSLSLCVYHILRNIEDVLCTYVKILHWKAQKYDLDTCFCFYYFCSKRFFVAKLQPFPYGTLNIQFLQKGTNNIQEIPNKYILGIIDFQFMIPPLDSEIT